MHPTGLITAFRRRPYAAAVAALLLGLAGLFLGRQRTEWDYVYVAASARLLAGDDIYAKEVGFTYPPFQALFAAPVVGLPKPAQRAAWFAVNAVCVVWLLRTAWRLAGGGPLRWHRDYPDHLACGLGLAVGFGFALNALAHHQTDVVLAALVVGGIDRLTRGHSLRAATLVGLAAAMKCTPLLFAPYLVVRGKPFAAAWLVVVAVGANLLPDAVSRPPGGGTWLARWSAEYLEPMARSDYAPGVWASEIVYNQSLVGLTNRWATTTCDTAGDGVVVRPVPPAAEPTEMKLMLIVAAVVCAGVALAAIAAAHRRADRAVVIVWECGLVIAGMLLFSPMSSPAHFGLLLLPGFALARAAVVHRRWWAGPVLAVALAGAVLTNQDVWGDRLYTIGLWYGSATWVAAATLVGCLAGLFAKSDARESEPTVILAARRTAVDWNPRPAAAIYTLTPD